MTLSRLWRGCGLKPAIRRIWARAHDAFHLV